MSEKYEELQRLVSAPDFWDADLYQQASALVAQLTGDDWASVGSEARQGDPELWERFLVSASGIQDAAALSLALDLMSERVGGQDARGLALFSCLAAQVGRRMSPAQLDQLADVWTHHPEWRSTIAQVAWRLGCSGQLRRLLGVPSWQALSGIDP